MTVRARSAPESTTALWILTILAVLFFFRAADTLLIPIALAVLISYALEPVVTWLVIIKSVAEHVERFKPLGRLMAP
jgi:predicted PurR-regulated permease PerM